MCGNKEHRSLLRNKKMKPYGSSRGLYWCWGCDHEKVPALRKPIKKTARQQAKKLSRILE